MDNSRDHQYSRERMVPKDGGVAPFAERKMLKADGGWVAKRKVMRRGWALASRLRPGALLTAMR